MITGCTSDIHHSLPCSSYSTAYSTVSWLHSPLTASLTVAGSALAFHCDKSLQMGSDFTMQSILSLFKLCIVLCWLPFCLGINFPTDNGASRRSLSSLCNGHAELCSRRYSNVTYVTAHNSPFNQLGNPGSNQAESIETQLNDGVRMRTTLATNRASKVSLG